MRPDPNTSSSIPGYGFGTPHSAISPVSETELALLEQTIGWTDLDAGTLKQHARIFQDKAESMADS